MGFYIISFLDCFAFARNDGSQEGRRHEGAKRLWWSSTPEIAAPLRGSQRRVFITYPQVRQNEVDLPLAVGTLALSPAY